MAVFDSENRRVVVRVVYDGPMMAGKTTNLRQIEGFFTKLRRSDVVVPGELGGRTLFFDWMHLDSGLVGGNPMRCQLVTVPGQAVLARRRRRILESADAVVFVCESTTRGVRLARGMVEALVERFEGSGSLPIVVQANKQDVAGALDVDEVRAQLALADTIPIVPARADEGSGVRESLVLAIRFAAAAAQRQLIGAGVEGMAAVVEGPDELLRELKTIDAEEGGRPDMAALTAAADRRVGEATDGAGGGAVGSGAPPVRRADERRELPPLPHAQLPLGHVWPAGRGREVLASLESTRCVLRTDLVGRQGIEDGSGTSDVLILEAGDRCLKTSSRRSAGDAEQARDRLLELIRRKRALGPLLLPDTVLALAVPEKEGEPFWLWTVTPWVQTLRARLAAAAEAGDEASVATALGAFAEAAALSLSLCARRGLVLDLHPSNFGFAVNGLCYLDDDVAEGTRMPLLAHALLQRVEEYKEFPRAVEIYLGAVEENVRARLNREDLTTTGFESGLAATPARSDAAQEAKQRLGALLRRRKKRH